MNFDSENESVDLTGQVALVTGGGRGLGRTFATALAAAGAAVAIVARSADQLAETARNIREAGGQVIPFVADVVDQQAATEIVHQVNQHLGPVDLLVNNAGTITPIGPVSETDADPWWRCMEVNLRGPLIYSRAVLDSMTARGAGRIINIASSAGIRNLPYLSAYAVSKAALIRLTEIMAAETREWGIRLFAIEPGTVRTALAEYALESPEGRKYTPWFGQIFEQGRDVPPDDSARLILLLASGKADQLSGRFMTVFDDLREMIDQIEKIEQEALYTLQLRRLR